MKEKYFMAFGDVHGHFELMFRTARDWEKNSGKSLSALLCTGDMDPVYLDLDRKYDYPLACLENYVDGDLKCPYKIIMVAGNNDDLFAYTKGEIAPNVFSLGRAGVLEVDGVLIGGISGVYNKGHFNEEINFNLIKSYPWYTYYNIDDISQILISPQPQVFLTHDWFIWNTSQNDDVYTSQELIKAINPRFMFSGHLHEKARDDFSPPQTLIKRLNRVHPSFKNYSYAFSCYSG